MIAVFAVLLVWPLSLLSVTHVINGIDPVNSVLIATAVTVFAIRYSIRQKKNGSKKKTLSL